MNIRVLTARGFWVSNPGQWDTDAVPLNKTFWLTSPMPKPPL
uniref:Uncharacterized protein n=1 Tax=Anguilla anguilla TaxID=7936 RepID=A0A0E9VVW4_ANGAN